MVSVLSSEVVRIPDKGVFDSTRTYCIVPRLSATVQLSLILILLNAGRSLISDSCPKP